MKRLQILAVIASAAVVTSCATTFNSTLYSDDLYTYHTRSQIAEVQKAEAEARKAEAEARRAEWEALMANAEVEALLNGSTATNTSLNSGSKSSFSSVVADTYESAYARRLYGFSSPSYRMPSSYFNYAYTDAYFYATAYDPAFYNIMVSGDHVWVEPKYITSMFGTWGATPVYAYSYYGWRRPYYNLSWWGYPHFSYWSYDPYWCYNWGWGGSIWGYPTYAHPYHPPYYVPSRPPHHTGGGNGHGYVQRPSNPRPTYSAPSHSSSGSSGTVYRGGTTTGSGQYRGNSSYNRGSSSSSSGQYRGSSSSYNSNSSHSNSGNNTPSSSWSSSSSRGSYSGGYSGGGNSSGGSHGGGSVRR